MIVLFAEQQSRLATSNTFEWLYLAEVNTAATGVICALFTEG